MINNCQLRDSNVGCSLVRQVSDLWWNPS